METKDKEGVPGFIEDDSTKFAGQFCFNPIFDKKPHAVREMLSRALRNRIAGTSGLSTKARLMERAKNPMRTSLDP